MRPEIHLKRRSVAAVAAALSSWVALSAPFGAAYTRQWSDRFNAEIDERIEKFRKADAVFDLHGIEAGAEVSVEQIASEFQFGCHIFNFDQFGDEKRNADYRAEFLPGGLFNAATVAFYWRTLEPMRGKPRYGRDAASDPEYWKTHGRKDLAWRRPAPGPVLDFLDANGISAHGHAIIYHKYHPKWSNAEMDGETRWKLYEGHIAELGKVYGARLAQWDIVNESIKIKSPVDAPVDVASYKNIVQPTNYTLRSFVAAGKVFPKSVKKCINGVYVGGNWPAFIAKLVKEGAPIDVIGHQMHIFKEKQVVGVASGEELRPNMVSWRAEDQVAMFRKYDEIGLPVHVSEITVPSPVKVLPREEAEALQARVLRDNYRLWFSWPSVYRITYWNMVDGMGADHEILESGLLRRDMTKKPAYNALWKLIHEDWRTKLEVAADADGKVRFRGFKGRYRLAWKDRGGQVKTQEVELK